MGYFCIVEIQNISYYTQDYESNQVYCVKFSIFLPNFKQICIFSRDFHKSLLNSSVSRVYTCGETDGRTDVKLMSAFRDRAKNYNTEFS